MSKKKYCEVCKKEINYASFSRHTKGKKHIRNLNADNADNADIMEEKADLNADIVDNTDIIDISTIKEVDIMEDTENVDEDITAFMKAEYSKSADINTLKKVDNDEEKADVKLLIRNIDNIKRIQMEENLINLILDNPEINLDDKLSKPDVDFYIKQKIKNMSNEELYDKIKMFKYNKNRVQKNTVLNQIKDFFGLSLDTLIQKIFGADNTFLEQQKKSKYTEKLITNVSNDKVPVEIKQFFSTVLNDTFGLWAIGTGLNILESYNRSGLNIYEMVFGSEDDEDDSDEEEEEEDKQNLKKINKIEVLEEEEKKEECTESVFNIFNNPNKTKKIKEYNELIEDKKQKLTEKELIKKILKARPELLINKKGDISEDAFNKYVLRFRNCI